MIGQLRKKIGLVLFLIIIVPATVVLADDQTFDNDRFTIECSEVSEDILLENEPTYKCSVKMNITNQSDDFEGTVKLLYYEGSEARRVDALGQTMQISSGETKTIYFTIPNVLYDDTPYRIPLRVDFLDKDGKTLCKKITDFQVAPNDGYSLAVGVCTDDMQKLKVIDQSSFKYETTSMSGNITMKARQFTEEELENIDQMNVNLLIFEQSISKTAWENVSKWVLKGGHLMMTRSVYQQMITKKLDAQNMTDWGNGWILVYDASDWSQAMFLSSVKSLFGSKGIERVIDGYYTEQYWNVNNQLSYDMWSQLPVGSGYLIILCIYILCMGPVVYFILKKKDKREYMWLLIPCTAILFSLIVYRAGSATRYTEPFVRFYTNVDLTEEATIENTKILVTCPDKGSAVMGVDGESNLQLLTNSYYMEPDKDAADNLEWMKKRLNDAEYNVAIAESDNKTTVLIKSDRAFDESYFVNTRVMQTDGTLEAALSYYQGALSGKVTNTTQWDLQHVFIIHNGLMFQIGDLPAGETLTLDDSQNVQILKTQSYMSNVWEIGNEGNAAAATEIMNTMIRNVTELELGEEDLIGGFALDYDTGVEKNSQITAVHGMALIKKKINVVDSGNGWSSQVFIGPEKSDNEEDDYLYDTDGYLIYGDSEIETSYSIKGLSGALSLKWLNADPDITLSFYNRTAGVYEQVMRDGDTTMQSDELKDYIAEDGTIKAHVLSKDATRDHYMPILTASGGEKHD